VTLDLAAIFGRLPIEEREKLFMREGKGHLNADGNRLVATQIAPLLGIGRLRACAGLCPTVAESAERRSGRDCSRSAAIKCAGTMSRVQARKTDVS